MHVNAHSALATLTLAAIALPGVVRAEPGWASGPAYDAVVAGREVDGTLLQVCRSNDPAYPGQHPGKTRGDWTSCAIAFGGKEVFVTSYETLRPVWGASESPVTNQWGIDSDGRTQLEFCRAQVGGGLHIGKRLGGGDEVWVSRFEVLTNRSPFAMRARSGSVSDLSIVGGYEADGTPLYLCIAPFQGGRHPGKTRRDWNACAIGWGGEEHMVPAYEVLESVIDGPLPQGYTRFVAGRDVNGAELGVCGGWADGGGSSQVGKYRFETGTCNIPFGGQEHVLSGGLRLMRGPIR